MKISDLHAARHLKFKLTTVDKNAVWYTGEVLSITQGNTQASFYVQPFQGQATLVLADKRTAEYLEDEIYSESQGSYWNLYVIEDANDNTIEIQTYTFQTKTDSKTPLYIRLSSDVERIYSTKKLQDMFVWSINGLSAVFSLRYKDYNKGAQKADIRLLSDKCFMYLQNNQSNGLMATHIGTLKSKSDLPIDVLFVPRVEFVSMQDSVTSNSEVAKSLMQMNAATTYFARWEAYNTLAKHILQQEVDDFGEIPYEAVKKDATENGMRFEFSTKEQPIDDKAIQGTNLAVQTTTDADAKQRYIWVGTVKTVGGGKIVTEYDSERIVDIPPKGVLRLSATGNQTILKRRDIAKARMLSGRSPIKTICQLIEDGSSEFFLTKLRPPITQELERNFKQARSMNAMQQEAIRIAINTPDIALIQGPPGTGKTTVIKAICERFREIFEHEHDGERPKILISSFQNEAVDNAVSDPLPGDIPAYRIGHKGEERFKQSIDSWADGVRKTLQSEIAKQVSASFGEKCRFFSDAYFVYKSSGEPLEKAIVLIKRYLAEVDIHYSKTLLDQADAILTAYLQRNTPDSDEDSLFVRKLREQRLSREAFLDDGASKAEKLLAIIKTSSDIAVTEDEKNTIKAVAYDDEFSEQDFGSYVSLVKRLLAKYAPEIKHIDIENKSEIDSYLLALSSAFIAGSLDAADSIDAKKAIIVGEFLEQLEDEATDLVRKYSLTTAATCQTSLQLHGGGDETYDLVIVDEAARATPLDLFIPMSMGRKIVLVGDHKQLPHMLEPDVVKQIANDPKYKSLDGIDVSLFERLFDILNTPTNTKAILLNQQYRMHPVIGNFVSTAFYDGKLKSDNVDLESRVVPNSLWEGNHLVVCDVPASKGYEYGNPSKARIAEVKAVVEDTKKILAAAPKATVGIITFYSLQRDRISEKIKDALNAEERNRVEVGTVDAFQGKQYDYVLLSSVRSNKETDEKKSVGHLVKPNRTCVAFSRARCCLVVYADVDTVMKVPYFSALIDICTASEEGCYYERRDS